MATTTLGALLNDLGTDVPEYVRCEPATGIGQVRADSREVSPGDLFVAYAGVQGDGHRFVAQALEAGAAAVLVQRGSAPTPPGPHIWLNDTATAFPIVAAAAAGWPQRQLRCVGITGTNGKTTTAHLVASTFAAASRPHARIGTTGNWLVDHECGGLFTTPPPLELHGMLARAVERGATDLVMEVSSHGLQQARVAPLEFDAVALTSFSQDHLDYHETMDDYFGAKLRLVHEYGRRGGSAVAPVDDVPRASSFLDAAAERGMDAIRVSRGADAGAEILAQRWTTTATGITADVRTPAGPCTVHTPLVGGFNLDNVLVALGLALSVGVSLDDAVAALATSVGAPGRLERVTGVSSAGPAVYVDYAHTPDAVARAIAAVRSAAKGRLITILGCGGDRDATKRPAMGAAASAGSDLFVATSDNPRTEDPDAIVDAMLTGVEAGAPVHREVDRARAIAWAIAEAADTDTVLIAGKGHEDYQILGTERVPFDDRTHARAALAQRASQG